MKIVWEFNHVRTITEKNHHQHHVRLYLYVVHICKTYVCIVQLNCSSLLLQTNKNNKKRNGNKKGQIEINLHRGAFVVAFLRDITIIRRLAQKVIFSIRRTTMPKYVLVISARSFNTKTTRSYLSYKSRTFDLRIGTNF